MLRIPAVVYSCYYGLADDAEPDGLGDRGRGSGAEPNSTLQQAQSRCRTVTAAPIWAEQNGLGYEPQFKLQEAVKDLGDWMRDYPA